MEGLETVPRGPCLWRKRWDSDYLVNLAITEGTFVTEYRLDPRTFDMLLVYMEPYLKIDARMAKVAMGTSKSQPISLASRLGAALIILAGGRAAETLRTHGMSLPMVYKNFDAVIDAINKIPELKIDCSNSEEACKKRAKEFESRSKPHKLFKYCVGASSSSSFASSRRRKDTTSL